MTKKILFIVGSNRRNSFNKQLSNEIIAMIGERAECSVLDYSDVPFLNQDEEYPAPAAIERLRASVAAVDALWIITPEYNASYPGLLKNVLDWLSRPVVRNDYATPTVVRGKKLCLDLKCESGQSHDCENNLETNPRRSQQSLNTFRHVLVPQGIRLHSGQTTSVRGHGL